MVAVIDRVQGTALPIRKNSNPTRGTAGPEFNTRCHILMWHKAGDNTLMKPQPFCYVLTICENLLQICLKLVCMDILV